MTINDRVDSRGQHPLPIVVERAIRGLESWTDARPNASWRVDQYKEFPNSRVFFIDVPCEHRSMRLVYKIMSASDDETWFQRNIPVVNIAVRDLDREGLRGAPILAVDESNNAVVTLFVPGDPLRPLLWRTVDSASTLEGHFGTSVVARRFLSRPTSHSLTKRFVVISGWRSRIVSVRLSSTGASRKNSRNSPETGSYLRQHNPTLW